MISFWSHYREQPRFRGHCCHRVGKAGTAAPVSGPGMLPVAEALQGAEAASSGAPRRLQQSTTAFPSGNQVPDPGISCAGAEERPSSPAGEENHCLDMWMWLAGLKFIKHLGWKCFNYFFWLSSFLRASGKALVARLGSGILLCWVSCRRCLWYMTLSRSSRAGVAGSISQTGKPWGMGILLLGHGRDA